MDRPVRLAIARIGRPHGIKGEATVELLTDRPETRLAVGNVLECDAEGVKSLEIANTRIHKGIWLLLFKGIEDRNGAERLRGSRLYSDVELEEPNEDGSYHDEQLVGLKVRSTDERKVGTVTGVSHLPGQDLLEVDTPRGSRLVPLVAQFIVDVDLESGTIWVDLPEGLVE